MRQSQDKTKAIASQTDKSHSLRISVFMAFWLALTLALNACSGAANETVLTATLQGNDDPFDAETGTLETPDILISTYQGANRLGGDEVTLSAIVSQGKPVVLNFWAALCAPCRAEMPDFQRIDDARSDEITIVGIDIGPQQFLGSRKEGKEVLVDLGIRYPVGTTFDGKIARNFEIVGMPMTFFINADGSLHRSWSGLLTERKINEIIDEMLTS